jgi:hypothetical protein
LTTYYLNDDTRKTLQSVGKMVQNFQLQLANNQELKLAIQRHQQISQSVGKVTSDFLVRMEPTFKEMAKAAAIYHEQMINISKIVQASGITETLQRVSEQMRMIDFTKINLAPLVDLPEDEPFEFVGEELPYESRVELETALEENGLATSDEPNEENVNLFIQMIQTTLNHPLSKEIGVGIVLGLILPVLYLALMQIGVDLKSVSDLNLPDVTILPIPTKNKEKEDE